MTYAGTIYSRELVRTLNGFPVKMYTFASALPNIYPDTDAMRDYLLEIVDQHPEITADPHMFAIAVPWGYNSGGVVRAMDVLSYKFDRPWETCNPDVDAWAFKDGIYRPEDREITCETTLIILGHEAQLRRRTKNLDEYLNSWPNIGELGPVKA